MIRMKAVKRFLGAYSVNGDRAGCIDDYLIGALGTGQTCLGTYGLVICKIKITVRSSGDKFHMGALRIRKKRLWSCPNSPDTLTFLNKVIGFNDIGIQFFNTQAPFKFVG